MQKEVSLHLPFPFYFLLLISEKIIHYGRKTSLEKILYSIVINCQATGTGTGTWDLGPGTWDLGPGTWDLGHGTWDMGPGKWE